MSLQVGGSEVETPIPVVDLGRLEANLARMATYASQHGLELRPHVKTHKTPRVGALQVAHGAAGLTCATPRELEVMSGVARSLLWAYPPVGARRLARLLAIDEAVALRVSLDSEEAIDGLAAAARAAGRTVEVLVEVDLGMRRVGVATPDEATRLARRIADATPLQFAGVAFYPGHIRSDGPEATPSLKRVSDDLAGVCAALDDAGLPARTVSGGSTPTAWRSHEIANVTEIRPGTYVYNDRATVASGVASREDCALTVLATVVSTAVPRQAVIDAGTKALGREPRGGDDQFGFGEVLEHPEVVVRAMSEEHGLLDLRRSEWTPRVGDQVRIIPNHVCIVTHLFDAVVVIRDGAVVDRWDTAARGR